MPVGQLPGFIRSLKKKNLKIVLAGGCFDVLHLGHVIFLQKAKKKGDVLMVMLESDRKAGELKGENRPIHTQKGRTEILSALEAVDYVVPLPYMRNDAEYDRLVGKIMPDVIAATVGGNNIHHQRLSKLTGAKLKFVTKKIGNYSTSKILNSTVQ